MVVRAECRVFSSAAIDLLGLVVAAKDAKSTMASLPLQSTDRERNREPVLRNRMAISSCVPSPGLTQQDDRISSRRFRRERRRFTQRATAGATHALCPHIVEQLDAALENRIRGTSCATARRQRQIGDVWRWRSGHQLRRWTTISSRLTANASSAT